ncbi:hypothetical protein ACFQ0M_48640 [Kitasatospora aburaviensis]
MSARFGDFIALAADHLADAGKMHVGEQSELRRKQLIAQIADFTEVLIGVEQRFAWEPVEALPHRSPAAGGLFPRKPRSRSTPAVSCT